MVLERPINTLIRRSQPVPWRRRGMVAAATFAMIAALVPALPAAAAAATVALVGDLQSELGCPGDWQPECATTELKPVDGQPDLYRSAFEVPAGVWSYKVALDDSWAVNYGAGGVAGGANLSLSLPTSRTVTFTFDNATHVVSD